MRALIVDLLPLSLASHVGLPQDCGHHQWLSDLNRFRLGAEDPVWVEEAIDRLPFDRCVFCEAVNPDSSEHFHDPS